MILKPRGGVRNTTLYAYIKSSATALIIMFGTIQAVAQSTPVASAVNQGHIFELRASIDPISWHHAEAECELHNGHLVTIASEAEQVFLEAEILPYYQPCDLHTDPGPWMGFRDDTTEGVWSWVTGEPVTYVKWRSGEPNNSNGEHYGNIECASSYSWNDRPSYGWNVVRHFICESSLVYLVSGDSYSGSSYELWAAPGPLGWQAAKAECNALGGHLVTIESSDEQDFLRNFLMPWHQPCTADHPGPWIGYTDEAVEAHWVWMTGEPTTYTDWATGEPNGGTGEQYAHIDCNRSDRWNDRQSDGANVIDSFICELPSVTGSVLFRDGFESGNVAAWH